MRVHNSPSNNTIYTDFFSKYSIIAFSLLNAFFHLLYCRNAICHTNNIQNVCIYVIGGTSGQQQAISKFSFQGVCYTQTLNCVGEGYPYPHTVQQSPVLILGTVEGNAKVVRNILCWIQSRFSVPKTRSALSMRGKRVKGTEGGTDTLLSFHFTHQSTYTDNHFLHSCCSSMFLPHTMTKCILSLKLASYPFLSRAPFGHMWWSPVSWQPSPQG